MATPIGHSLVGYAVYKAFEPYGLKNRALLAMLVAIAPDFDFIPGLVLGTPALYHQSVTHSVGFALASSVAIALICRRKHERFSLLLSLCFALYISHLVIDFFGPDGRAPYGQPIFWPVSDAYFIAPFEIFRGVRHGGSTDASILQWAQGLLTPYNLKAIIVEIVLIGPLILPGLYWRTRGR